MRCTNGGGSAFSEWFADNYLKIRERLSVSNTLNEDSLHDAYLYIVTTIHTLRPNEYLQQFKKVYRLKCRKELSRSFRYAYPDPLFFDFLHDDDDVTEDTSQRDTRPSAKRVMQYVKLHTNQSDYEAFSLYMVQNMPYSYIADYIGISPTNVRKKIDGIKQSVQHYFNRKAV